MIEFGPAAGKNGAMRLRIELAVLLAIALIRLALAAVGFAQWLTANART